jgi:hypothetical protein
LKFSHISSKITSLSLSENTEITFVTIFKFSKLGIVSSWKTLNLFFNESELSSTLPLVFDLILILAEQVSSGQSKNRTAKI